MNRQGFGLIEVLVGGVILGMILYFMQSGLQMADKGARDIGMRADIDILRETLASYTDCERSFQSGGATAIDPVNPGVSCNSKSATPADQVGPFVRLRRKSLNNTEQWMTGALDVDGSAKVGKWRMRVSCSKDEQSLVVRVIPDNAKAQWADSRLLFGGNSASFPLCFRSPAAGAASLWHNSECRWDVNRTGSVEPQDALIIGNAITAAGAHILSPDSATDSAGGIHPLPGDFIDVNNDNRVDMVDRTLVLNYITLYGPGACQGGRADRNLSWHKAGCRWDVNNDGNISSNDRILIVNILNNHGAHSLAFDTTGDALAGVHPVPGSYVDVDNDGWVTQIDADLITAKINSMGVGGPCP